MQIIDSDLTQNLTNVAQNNDRKRKNYNFHTEDSDRVQRMLNAFEPGTYVRPHTHQNPDKREVFVVLTGSLLVVFFDKLGHITNHVVLNGDTGTFGVEIKPGEWHSATGLKKGTVVYEIKDGPYNVNDDKNFAPWSPEENTTESEELLNDWLNELGLKL